ncbi:xanthine dehydrogenase family protein molybdopterin-binding subunit [Rhizobium sp. SEMIA 4085]|uniref:Xanthine dehydrogenase YagR molybdopterin-binding subunit protein n=1 Tax=Rhizobium gallicum bv. gallicum R602sp TaxID=1041138 RepID=A0A0B4XI64_9HYPH|nr:MULTISPECIES: xanthine dehydrogenase family protein molybdopterin-binding subunit [Rhizobium]AJD46415.1 xanthine dehydrogenase YagR molybdopterin-binding subunit protein [Rhizobium gallicum bv. gallicum R602sp]NNH28907.1 xanthine dehydrogenase family protein molybdopterin-binding subunit [Rhizobium sp. SEMIA 4085]
MTVMEPNIKRGDAADGVLGGRLSRLDGPAKITGKANYALENQIDGVVHGVMVQSTIAAGTISSMDISAAEASPGVLLVLTPDNIMELKSATTWAGTPGPEGPYLALTNEITFNGQHVAAVFAETLEQATAAAASIKVSYVEKPAIFGFDDPGAGEGIAVEQMTIEWGNAEQALAEAAVRIEAEYRTPREYNVPIEPHGLIAKWDGDVLTLWEPSQWVDGMARSYAEWFELPFENVRIISPYIGGGFGSKALSLPHAAVAIMAARRLGRPVKLAVTRAQTFTAFGGRPATRQTLALGATKEGKLLSIVQRGANETAMTGAAVEPLGAVTSIMYDVPNFSSRQNIVPVHTVLPGALRAPGENPSAWGLESAIDELAYAVGIDPVEIRLLNYAEQDPHAKIPWSTRQLREAFAVGGEAFGWSKRSPKPCSMRDGNALIGWGVAAGTYPVRRTPGEALVRILADGTAEIASSSIDMGQGTYTIMAQTAAEVLGIPVEKIHVKLGDSALPRAPVAGGSQLANLMTGAVHKAALAARDELIGLALNDVNSPFRDAQANTLTISEGRILPPRGEGEGVAIADFMRQIGREKVETLRDTLPEDKRDGKDRYDNFTTMMTMKAPTEGGYSLHSWCAHFVEVRVDEDFGTVRVSRMVSALDSGRLYNPKLAESQWRGGIIMGIGQALLEEGIVDERYARVINNNLADYLVPTNSDVPDLQVISVGIPDYRASVLGGKAVGELPIVGVAPAIANAVFHATGKRIRSLPITLEKLI